MKKTKFLLCAFLLCAPFMIAVAANVEINATNFPDENFRNYLLSQSYGEDGLLTEEEIDGITAIVVSNQNISDLTGIKYFTSLTVLHCNSNQLTTLDISNRTKLQSFICDNNQLTYLNVSGCTALQGFTYSNNPLTVLDVSGCTQLIGIGTPISSLTSIDASGCTTIKSINCSNSQITSLNVSGCIELQAINCSNTPLASLDVSDCIGLRMIDCTYSQLTSLDLSKNPLFTTFYCYCNQIKGVSMDALINSLPENPEGKLYVYYEGSPDEGNVCTKAHVAIAETKGWKVYYTTDGGQLWRTYEGCDDGESTYEIVINEENFPDMNFRNYLLEQNYGQDGVITEAEIKRITDINVSNKNISSLEGIEHFAVLKELWCYRNKLTALDVSKNTALTTLICYSNKLTSLDVSANTALTYLSCGDNQLTSLDVSTNTALTDLSCEVNLLTELNVSTNTALTYLGCGGNQIKGKAMDELINSLPQNETNAPYKLYIYSDSDVYGNEGNICTKSQVAVAKAKGWTPYYYDNIENIWLEYEGSEDEDTSIAMPEVEDGNAIAYTLSGQKVTKAKKGIYIVNGKKVVVK